MKDKNSLGGRVARYARVTGAMGGLAARAVTGRALGKKWASPELAIEMRQTLGALKGPLMKVAQILATIPDVLPPEYVDELSQLQADAPPMGWPFVKRRMASELGADWQKHFKDFPQTASAAASLGQVHKATTSKGQVVACKLQYPDMASAIEADLRQLKLAFALFEKYDKAIQTQKIQAEIADRLREELDYTREAKAIGLYRLMLAKTLLVHIPQVVENLSTPRLLTMSWLSGEKLVNVVERPLAARNEIALNLFKAWYVPFYHYGVIHGDPHLGNYSVCKDNSINLLDFGCIRIFKPELVNGVINLYRALRDNQPDLAVEAYKAWGFVNPSKKLIEALNIWAGFIYAPVLQDKTRLIEETNTGIYGRETAHKMHTELRKIGGVEIPREFVFMDRSAIGLGSVFLRLKAEVNWYREFHSLIDGFSLKKLHTQQQKILPDFGFKADQ